MFSLQPPRHISTLHSIDPQPYRRRVRLLLCCRQEMLGPSSPLQDPYWSYCCCVGVLIFLGPTLTAHELSFRERTREIDTQIGRPDGALCGPSGTRNARLG